MSFKNFSPEKKFRIDDWVFMDPMGEGSSAAAIIVYHRESLRTFAIRTINLEKFNNELNDIKNEL